MNFFFKCDLVLFSCATTNLFVVLNYWYFPMFIRKLKVKNIEKRSPPDRRQYFRTVSEIGWNFFVHSCFSFTFVILASPIVSSLWSSVTANSIFIHQKVEKWTWIYLNISLHHRGLVNTEILLWKWSFSFLERRPSRVTENSILSKMENEYTIFVLITSKYRFYQKIHS